MRYIFSFLFCLWIHVSSFSQEFLIRSGKVMDRGSFIENLGVRPFSSSLLSSIKGGTNNRNLIYFDKKQKISYIGLGSNSANKFLVGVFKDYVNFTQSKPVTSEIMTSKESSLYGFFEINGLVYLIYSSYDKINDSELFYVNQIDDEFTLLGTPVILYKIDNVKQSGKEARVIASESKKSILIVHSVKTNSKDTEKINCKVVDENFAQLWFKDFDFNKREKDMLIDDISLDDAGNLFLLATVKEKKDKAPYLFTYNWKIDSYKSTRIGTPDRDIFGYSLKVVKGKIPVIASLYKKNKEYGYSFYTINLTENPAASGTATFSKEFDKWSRFGAFLPEYFYVTDIVGLDNGSFVFSIEGNFVKSGSPSTTSYHSSPTLIVSINSAGNENWNRFIYKKQYGVVGQFTNGHSLTSLGNKAVILYNDNRDNFSKTVDDDNVKPLANGYKNMITAQTIDEKGNAKKHLVSMPNNVEDFALFPSFFNKIDGGLFQIQLTRVKGMKINNCLASVSILE